jgi:hypothetical protein
MYRRRRVLAGTHTKTQRGVAAKIRHGLAPGQVFADRPPGFFVRLPHQSAAPEFSVSPFDSNLLFPIPNLGKILRLRTDINRHYVFTYFF